MIQTKFNLKPYEKMEFEEGKIVFTFNNKSDKDRKIKIEIKWHTPTP